MKRFPTLKVAWWLCRANRPFGRWRMAMGGLALAPLALWLGQGGIGMAFAADLNTQNTRLEKIVSEDRLTLPQAVHIGLKDNRTIRAAYLRRVSQKFDLRVAEDKFTPKLTIGGKAIRQKDYGIRSDIFEMTPVVSMLLPTNALTVFSWGNSVTVADGTGRTRSSALNFDVIQPLLKDAGFDASMRSVRLARIEEQIARLDLKGIVAETVSGIVFSYRDVIRRREQIDLARAALRRAQDLFAVNTSLIAAGRMAAVEIIQTKAEIATQELAVVQAESDYAAAVLTLQSAIAGSPRTRMTSVDKLTVKRVDVYGERAMAVALRNNPDYLAQRLVTEQMKISVDYAKNQRLWDVSAVAGTTYQVPRLTVPQRDKHHSFYAGLQFMIPFGDLSPEQGEVNATIDLRTAELRFEEVRQQIEQRVITAVRDVDTHWRQLELARTARELSIRKIEIEREKLSVGRSTNFQVISFESDLRAAETAVLDATLGYLNALTTIDQAMGTTLETWQIKLND